SPGPIRLLPVADSSVQRVETYPQPRTGRRQLARGCVRVLVEIDRIGGAHVEPEPLDQGSLRHVPIVMLVGEIHLRISARDRPELAPVARFAAVPLAHDPHHGDPPSSRCSPVQVGEAKPWRDVQAERERVGAELAVGCSRGRDSRTGSQYLLARSRPTMWTLTTIGSAG